MLHFFLMQEKIDPRYQMILQMNQILMDIDNDDKQIKG